MNTKRGAFEENLFSRMDAQNNLLKRRNISVLEKEIWNAAIEKAALICYDGGVGYPITAEQIRKLKI